MTRRSLSLNPQARADSGCWRTVMLYTGGGRWEWPLQNEKMDSNINHDLHVPRILTRQVGDGKLIR